MTGAGHRWLQRLAAGTAGLCLLFGLQLPATAQSAPPGGWLSRGGQRAAQWLQQAVPQPGAGHDNVVFALLRSGLVNGNDPGIQHYVQDAQQHYKAQDTASLPTGELARQALVLTAAGQDPAAVIPGLWESLGDGERLMQDGLAATQSALLLYGYEGAQPPEALAPSALAATLAQTQAADGGYGGEGDRIAQTARMLQALAPYRVAPEVDAAVSSALSWLAQRQSGYGGFEEDGAPSAWATAEVVIALACLEMDTLLPGGADPADALLIFQNEDGSFSADPDKPADIELTALCTLALAARCRQQAGMPGVYKVGDALPDGERPGSEGGGVSQPPPEAGASSEPFEGPLWAKPLFSLPYVGGIPAWMVGAGIGALMVLVVVLAGLASRGKKRNKRHNRRAKLRRKAMRRDLPRGEAPVYRHGPGAGPLGRDG